MPQLGKVFALLLENREAWNTYSDNKLLEELGDEY